MLEVELLSPILYFLCYVNLEESIGNIVAQKGLQETNSHIKRCTIDQTNNCIELVLSRYNTQTNPAFTFTEVYDELDNKLFTKQN